MAGEQPAPLQDVSSFPLGESQGVGLSTPWQHLGDVAESSLFSGDRAWQSIQPDSVHTVYPERGAHIKTKSMPHHVCPIQ